MSVIGKDDGLRTRKPHAQVLSPHKIVLLMEPIMEGSGQAEVFRISGHQTFALRIAWIPKAAAMITDGEDPFTNPDDGIVRMGLGKNMVESLRVWIEAFQVAEKTVNGWTL